MTEAYVGCSAGSIVRTQPVLKFIDLCSYVPLLQALKPTDLCYTVFTLVERSSGLAEFRWDNTYRVGSWALISCRASDCPDDDGDDVWTLAAIGGPCIPELIFEAELA